MNMLVSAAATATALPVSADANADPIFAALEELRRADAAIDAWCESSHADIPEGLAAHSDEAEQVVLRTRPTTPAGLGALTSWAHERTHWIAHNFSTWDAESLCTLIRTINEATCGIAGLKPWAPPAVWSGDADASAQPQV